VPVEAPVDVAAGGASRSKELGDCGFTGGGDFGAGLSPESFIFFIFSNSSNFASLGFFGPVGVVNEVVGAADMTGGTVVLGAALGAAVGTSRGVALVVGVADGASTGRFALARAD
jgi:hypothetical protein